MLKKSTLEEVIVSKKKDWRCRFGLITSYFKRIGKYSRAVCYDCFWCKALWKKYVAQPIYFKVYWRLIFISKHWFGKVIHFWSWWFSVAWVNKRENRSVEAGKIMILSGFSSKTAFIINVHQQIKKHEIFIECNAHSQFFVLYRR